jgi:hypothetical protein
MLSDIVTILEEGASASIESGPRSWIPFSGLHDREIC